MTGHKANVIISLDLVNISEQVRKIVDLTVVALCILTVAVDVLTEQSYILVSCFNQSPDLGDNILGSAASLSSADVRHDTVGAEIFASVHYRDPRAIARLAIYRQSLCNEIFLFLGTVKAKVGVGVGLGVGVGVLVAVGRGVLVASDTVVFVAVGTTVLVGIGVLVNSGAFVCWNLQSITF